MWLETDFEVLLCYKFVIDVDLKFEANVFVVVETRCIAH